MPRFVLVTQLDRWQRPELSFSDGEPIVPQIEQWAKYQKLGLSIHWKVDLAKRVKSALLANGANAVPAGNMEWERIFTRFLNIGDAVAAAPAAAPTTNGASKAAE